jgi:hypothetical protein
LVECKDNKLDWDKKTKSKNNSIYFPATKSDQTDVAAAGTLTTVSLQPTGCLGKVRSIKKLSLG